MLQRGVGGEHRVVRLNNRTGELRRWVNTKLEFGLLSIVSGKALKEQSTKTGTSSSTKGVEDEEALETRAVVCQAAKLVHDRINELFSNGIVTASIYESLRILNERRDVQ